MADDYTPTTEEVREAAEKQAVAYAKMLEYDEGVGGLGVRHPDMFEDMLAWDALTGNGHADTVLRLLAVIAAQAAAIEGALAKMERFYRSQDCTADIEAAYLLLGAAPSVSLDAVKAEARADVLASVLRIVETIPSDAPAEYRLSAQIIAQEIRSGVQS